jgi:hypothetical protein
MHSLEPRFLDDEVGRRVEYLFERDARLEPCERRSEAGVRARAEAQVIAALRRMSYTSARSNLRSSRLAEIKSSATLAPAGMVRPWSATSSVVVRAIICVGPSKRIVSSRPAARAPGR